MTLTLCFVVILEDLRIESCGDAMFSRKKKENKPSDFYVHTSNEFDVVSQQTLDTDIRHIDSKMARLMELIGWAIYEWSLEYHLENLPKKIIFEQVFDALHAIELNFSSKEW